LTLAWWARYDKGVQAASIRHLADVPFTYLLPGHGRRFKFGSDREEKRRMLEDAAQRLESS
jgi:glyoxylase-like metal-dependent hydrolase (beta-lactamase superfamily II)